jgi:hypothetical protein
MRWIARLLVAVLLCFWAADVSADFVLTLKNGRRIAIQNYREEGQVVKFSSMGGEISINKDQIQSIQKAGGELRTESNSIGGEPPSTSPARVASDQSTGTEPAAGRPLSAEEERAKEEKEYQQRLRDVTQQLQEVRDRYSEAVRGTTSKDATLLTTEEQLKARTDDIIARQKDEQQNPTDPGVLKMLTPSPFTSLPPTTTELRAPAPVGPAFATPPPVYTDRQKELSDLRNQAIQVEKERERLIEEMKQKNFNTGSLFLE